MFGSNDSDQKADIQVCLNSCAFATKLQLYVQSKLDYSNSDGSKYPLTVIKGVHLTYRIGHINELSFYNFLSKHVLGVN